MKKGIVILLSIISLCCAERVRAQDAQFSQVYSSPLYLSPSFAGFTPGGRVILNYRDQWPGVSESFRTYALSYDQYISSYNSGVGLLFMRDDQGGGQLITQNIGINYAYELAVTRDITVRPGLQFKYAERKIDPGRLSQVGPDGEIFPWINADFPVEQFRNIDATASVMVYNDFLWSGVTVDNLIKNDIGFTDIETRLPVKTVLYGGGKWVYQEASRSTNEQSATMAFVYRNQAGFQQLDVGVYWNTSPIEAGIWYRGIPGVSSESLTNNDALIFSLGLDYESFHIAYSYDLTLSGLAGYTSGSNEISLIYRFDIGPVLNPPRGPIPCTHPAHGLGDRERRPERRRTIF
ncbi:type IX secretion system membrane protein PorP/SprF [Marinilabiliaceae bacterium ANBcel2]|nr:type IX secretion system membrane protein PorP/SprF [Marinilabiliaceae bacterium ANBcel2]